MADLQHHIDRATEIFEQVQKMDRDLRVNPRLIKSKVGRVSRDFSFKI